MKNSKKGISFPIQGAKFKRETTNGYFNPTSIPAAIQQNKNRKNTKRSMLLASRGVNIPQQSTRTKEPTQSNSFRSGRKI
tara:strand:- start:1916 stop:2155 length:240 start_codon:yes stop_codon:yes gene_type:complete